MVNRYSSAPVRSLWNVPAIFYVGFNMAASLSALALMHTFGWTFGTSGDSNAGGVRWTQVMAAGFGAMALLRSSIFIARARDRDIAIGPGGLVVAFLRIANREVDRSGARNLLRTVKPIMKDVHYAKAYQELPLFCLALMQDVSPEQQEALYTTLGLLNAAHVEDDTKVLLLGVELIRVVGEGVLTEAVDTLRDKTRAQC